MDNRTEFETKVADLINREIAEPVPNGAFPPKQWVTDILVVDHREHNPEYKGFVQVTVREEEQYTFLNMGVIESITKRLGGRLSAVQVGVSAEVQHIGCLQLVFNNIDVLRLRKDLA